ncbi:MAG: amidohydrolase [Gemmatimonadetes bacterium]|nr:amidohydrolase [Gemmatimonadota bacterium]
MRRMHLRAALSGAALLTIGTSTLALAQLGSYNPAPGPQGTFAITNAHIFPVSGPEIMNGTIVISGGKIQAVGANAAIPAGAQVIDAKGLNVYPGMMDGGTSIGLSEIPQGAASTVDISEIGSFNPNSQAYYGINPHSAHVGVARVVGITSVISRPTGGIISGQAALINLAGWTVPSMAVVPRVAMVIELPGGGGGRRGGGGGGAAAFLAAQGGNANVLRARQLDSLKQILHDADAYAKALDAYASDKTIPRPKHDAVLESLIPAIRGQQEVMFPADRAVDIRAAVAFAEEFHLKPIIVGGREAVSVAAYLKQHDVPVLYTGVLQLPGREDDPYDINYSAPAKLAAAGVKFAITSGDCCSEVRNLPSIAGMASAFGLSKADALKAVTLGPAQIFGVADKLGSLEVGKMANIVVTDGDMLEARTNTKYLFIDGRMVPLDTKHTQLYDLFKGKTLVP